jgi:hypothetical protein
LSVLSFFLVFLGHSVWLSFLPSYFFLMRTMKSWRRDFHNYRKI